MNNIFQGVIEDVNDPLLIGRVRVRIFGVHSIEKIPNDTTGKGIPTDDLPWCQVSSSVTSASVSGVGESPLGCVNGAHVWGFSRDIDYMDLVVCGTFVGIPKTLSSGNGFQDPDKFYPTRIDESDLSRLSRGDIKETWVENQQNNITTNELFSEPKSTYAAEYPFNKVNVSRSGHTAEIDDTPNNERLSNVHKSGTYTETGPDGTQTNKIVKDKYNITLGDEYIHVSGNVKIFVDGNVTQIVNGDIKQTVGGGISQDVTGDITQTVGGNITQAITGNVGQTIGGNVSQSVTGNMTQTIGGMYNINSSGPLTIKSPMITLDGMVTITQTLTVMIDAIIKGISFTLHKHLGNLQLPTLPPF